MPGPLILIGAGSGLVPIISILRHHINNLKKDHNRKVVILISAENIENILYYKELAQHCTTDPNIKLIYTLTQNTPNNWQGFNKRIDKQILTDTIEELKDKMPLTYICGPTTFVETIANLISEIGFNSDLIKTERFG